MDKEYKSCVDDLCCLGGRRGSYGLKRAELVLVLLWLRLCRELTQGTAKWRKADPDSGVPGRSSKLNFSEKPKSGFSFSTLRLIIYRAGCESEKRKTVPEEVCGESNESVSELTSEPAK